MRIISRFCVLWINEPCMYGKSGSYCKVIWDTFFECMSHIIIMLIDFLSLHNNDSMLLLYIFYYNKKIAYYFKIIHSKDRSIE